MRQVLFLILTPTFLFCSSNDKDTNKWLVGIQYQTFVKYEGGDNISFQGNNILINTYRKLNGRHEIGCSTGFFHYQNKSSILNKKIKYNYLPLSLLYTYNLRKSFLQISCGFNALSFFDSDFYIGKSSLGGNKNFWPEYYSLEDNELDKDLKKRKTYWIIINPSYHIKVWKFFYFNTGFTFYVGNKNSFCYLNIGLNTKFDLK